MAVPEELKIEPPWDPWDPAILLQNIHTKQMRSRDMNPRVQQIHGYNAVCEQNGI